MEMRLNKWKQIKVFVHFSKNACNGLQFSETVTFFLIIAFMDRDLKSFVLVRLWSSSTLLF